jgi:hypothetical protein
VLNEEPISPGFKSGSNKCIVVLSPKNNKLLIIPMKRGENMRFKFQIAEKEKNLEERWEEDNHCKVLGTLLHVDFVSNSLPQKHIS